MKFIPGRYYSYLSSKCQFVRPEGDNYGYFIDGKGEDVLRYTGPDSGWTELDVEFTVGKRYVYGNGTAQYELLADTGSGAMFKNITNGQECHFFIGPGTKLSPVIERKESTAFIKGRKYRTKFGFEATYIGPTQDPEWGIFENSQGRQEFLLRPSVGWTLVASPDLYIVWGPSGHTNPRVKFRSQEEAVKAARAMTITHRQVFYAMKAVAKFEARVTVEAVEV